MKIETRLSTERRRKKMYTRFVEFLAVFGFHPQKLATEAAAGTVILGTRCGFPCI